MHRFIRRNPPPRERKYYKKTAGRRTLPVRRDFARPIQRYVVRVLEDDTDYPEYPYFLRIAPYKDGYDAVLEILANATIFDTKHAAHSALQYYKSMIDAAELAHMTFQIVVFRPDLRKEDVLDNPPMRSKYKSYKRLQPVQSYVVRIYHDLVEEPVYLTKYYENFINERGERAWYFAPTRYFTQVVVFNTKEEAKRAFFRYRGRLSSSLRDGVSFVVEVFRPDVTGSKNIVNNPHGLEFPQIGEPSAWAIAIFDRGGLLPISYVRSTKYETPEITESQHNALSYVTKEAATGVMDVRAFGIRLAYKKYWSEVSGITVPASDVVLEAVPYAGHDKYRLLSAQQESSEEVTPWHGLTEKDVTSATGKTAWSIFVDGGNETLPFGWMDFNLKNYTVRPRFVTTREEAKKYASRKRADRHRAAYRAAIVDAFAAYFENKGHKIDKQHVRVHLVAVPPEKLLLDWDEDKKHHAIQILAHNIYGKRYYMFVKIDENFSVSFVFDLENASPFVTEKLARAFIAKHEVELVRMFEDFFSFTCFEEEDIKVALTVDTEVLDFFAGTPVDAFNFNKIQV